MSDFIKNDGNPNMASAKNELPELLPTIYALSRADKLRLMQHLVVDLAQEESIPLLLAGSAYPIWTPHGAYDAAATLTQMMEAEKTIA